VRQNDRVTLTPLVVAGHVIAEDIYLRGCLRWYRLPQWWQDQFNQFQQENQNRTPPWLLPDWLNRASRPAEDRLNPQPPMEFRDRAYTVYPALFEPRYHWYDPDEPIYVRHEDDDGLRWDLIRWTDVPKEESL
jgi:hypothetical protein